MGLIRVCLLEEVTVMEKVAVAPSGLGELAEVFLLSKRVAGVSEQTLLIYGGWLTRFTQSLGQGACDAVSVTRFFADLRARGLATSSVHQAYRSVKTFLRWCLDTGTIEKDPMRGFRIRLPKTLPKVPTDEEIQAVLSRCKNAKTAKRNRALILVMADAGLRASEVVWLLVENWSAFERSLFVRGKGKKDRTVFVGPSTIRAIRDYLSTRRIVHLDDFLFVNDDGRPLTRRHLITILHRLSAVAGLPTHRRLHPHALRHYAATSWLRNDVGLDEVRRLLGHESLSTTLRYSSLVSADLQRAHKRAAAIERLRVR
jgi:integrase/recombinase XerC